MRMRAPAMRKTSRFIVTLFSVLPPFLLLAALFEPWFYGLGWNRAQVADISDMIRIGAGVLVLVMILYFAIYLHRTDDPKVVEKKSLWTWVLILGNVFAVPVFWYVFIWRPRKGDLRPSG